MMERYNEETFLKAVLLGQWSVGKSTLCMTYLTGHYPHEDDTPRTFFCEDPFLIKLNTGKLYHLAVWDIAHEGGVSLFVVVCFRKKIMFPVTLLAK